MNKLWKEELENKLKNKVFFWDEKSRLWRNVLDTADCMSDSEYEVLASLRNFPLP